MYYLADSNIQSSLQMLSFQAIIRMMVTLNGFGITKHHPSIQIPETGVRFIAHLCILSPVLKQLRKPRLLYFLLNACTIQMPDTK